ncbi:unnamed protein product [Sphagnum balticum]
MDLFSELGLKDRAFIPYLNTGTQYDLATGSFIPGMNGSMVLNGGLAGTNAVVGRPQLYKSTTALGLVMSALAIYPESRAMVYDTEFSQTEERLCKIVDNPLIEYENLEDRLHLSDKSQYSAESHFKLLQEAAASRLKNQKDYMVETPFLNPKTGKPYLMWIPLIVAYDSWSKMSSDAVMEVLERKDVSSTDTNMMFMRDGMVKTKIMGQIPSFAAKYGIYFMLTAHVGDKFELNPYAASPKQLQYMKGTDKIKGVGSDFNFLASTLIQMHSAKVLQDNDKQCLYPDQFSNAVELSQVTSVIMRCKNNMSGTQVSPVISQQLGLQSALSNYNYLKEHDYAGLVGNKVTHKPALLAGADDQTMGRTTVRAKITDYRTARAIEIMTQFHHIQNNWSLRDMPINFTITIEQMAEQLAKGSTYTMNDILESTGYWTYGKSKRNYMSIFDIIAMMEYRYVPKWLAVKTK